MKNLLPALFLTTAISGCAVNMDPEPLQEDLDVLKYDTVGQCISAAHAAAMYIDEADKALASTSGNGTISDIAYKKAEIAIEKAAENKLIVLEYCNAELKSVLATMIIAEAEIYDKVHVLPGVVFEENSSTLTKDAKTILTAVASRLAQDGDSVEIAGHTSNTGDADYNMQLSEKRAEAVKDYLVSQGVLTENMVVKGYGETQPIATNATKEGQQANKRVEIRYMR